MAGPSFTVRIEDRALAERFRQWPGEQRKAMQGGLEDIADAVFTASQEKVPVDTGTLKKSGSVTFGDLSATVGYAATYAAPVEFGSRPHHLPRTAIDRPGMPGLRTWAARHGMPGAEWAIAKSIAKRGTKAQPYLIPAFEETKPLFNRFVGRRLSEAWERLKARMRR